MEGKVRIGFGLLIATGMFLSGCAGLGPRTVARDRFDYTAVLSDSWKEQMLLNMVKLRYGDAPIFLDVASVINSYEVSGSANLGADTRFRPSFGPSYETGVNVGASGFYANRPTITYSPLSGEKFARSLMTPIPISAVLSLIESGYPADLVFRVLVQSVNGLKNQYGGRRSADPEFYLLVEKTRRIQDTGAIGVRSERLKEGELPVIVFRAKIAKEIEADVAEVKKMLGLDLQTREFKVVYDMVQTSDKEIAMLTRSMLQVLGNLASYIEVPEMDVTEKRVSPGFKGESVAGVPVSPLVRISSSSHRPDDAFVTVPYQKHWFWIDNKDLLSKQIFSFLMFIFTLVETGGKEGAPVVTVPVR